MGILYATPLRGISHAKAFEARGSYLNQMLSSPLKNGKDYNANLPEFSS